MSDDLERRLRDLTRMAHSDTTIGDEAADELARLRAENEALRAKLTDPEYTECCALRSKAEAENEALTIILNRCTEGTEWTFAQVPDEIAALSGECERLRENIRLQETEVDPSCAQYVWGSNSGYLTAWNEVDEALLGLSVNINPGNDGTMRRLRAALKGAAK